MEQSRNKIARLAGLIYLLLVISGILYLVYIPAQLINYNDVGLTISNIQNQESLYRTGIAIAIISSLIYLLLPLQLYWLLHQVNKNVALLMVIFVLVCVPLAFVNILHEFSILNLVTNADILVGLSNMELQYQVAMHLSDYQNGIMLSQIFWGLWLLPFGFLVYQSGFLPKFLGIFLMLGCFGYLIEFFAHFLIPTYNGSTFQSIAGIPAPIGEIGICLWLLIMGTNKITFRKKSSIQLK